MNHVCILIFLLSSQYVHLQLIDFLLSPPKGKSGYTLGEKVVLTCVVKGDSTMSVLFSHNNIYAAENGLCNFPQYKCEKKTVGDRLNYILEIDYLTWKDGGEWLCVRSSQSMPRTIDIRVAGKVAPLKTELIKSGESQNQQYVPDMLYGKGLRTNPFDLTRGASVHVYCSTGCSNPISMHEWSYRNASIHSRALHSGNYSSKCSFNLDGHGVATESNVTIDCVTLNMVGSNEITCSMTGSNDSRSAFVLCPGGHKPWTLTNGEIIGISIAVGLAALMIVMFFMSAKRVINSYRYGSVGQGIRV